MSLHKACAKSPEDAELEVEHRWPGVSCDAEYDQGDFVVTIVPLASESAIDLAMRTSVVVEWNGHDVPEPRTPALMCS